MIKKDSRKEVGYRSFHYVVLVSKERRGLPEYKNYKDLKFEIQIRTILEHAWAEIEHDRNYKSASELPLELRLEFSSLSKNFLSVDQRFQRLVDKIEKYHDNISRQTRKGNLDTNIDSVSIEGYLREKFRSGHPKRREELVDKDIVDELESRGIKSLRDLEDMISRETEKYARLSGITQSSFPSVAIADVYNSRDKKILRPRYMKSLSDLSHISDTKCVNELKALRNTGLGGYPEGIIPSSLIERCEKKGEIRLTKKGLNEVNRLS